ncbi:MAG: CvpA family protein [Firmicutes bacterium]|nr:CvpA family protein [Bacillota bacterium]
MWMDIAIAVIVGLSAVFGFISGFVKTFLHTVGWILSIVLGFIWYPQLKDFLIDNTNYYLSMRDAVSGRLDDAAGSAITEVFGNIPDVLERAFIAASETLTDSLAETVTNLFFSIISLVIIVAGIKLVFWILIQLFSKTKNEGFTGFVDGVLGLGFGLLKGVLLVLILMALMVPLSNFADTTFFTDAIAESQVAKILYNANPILLFVKGLL